jgi:exodeoxyribonuclease VII large subunit
VLFSPALVQGDQAPDSIVKAIHRVIRDNRSDVLILSRGGGAIEDMACFNDERVVRAIAECPIPVIAGIGHQRDESLADLVADVYAHTPTAAAEQAVPCLADLYTEHRERMLALNDAMQYRLEVTHDRLQRIQTRLLQLKLDRRLQHEAQLLTWMRQRLVQGGVLQLQQAQQHTQLLKQKLATLDPEAVLKRGYAVVRRWNGAIARSTAEISSGQKLLVQLGQGHLKVTVTEVSHESEPNE